MNLDDIITLAEAARELHLSPVTLRAQAANGRLRARNVGKTWITTRDEVVRYKAENLGQVGRPLEETSIPWPGNQYGHARLYVTFDGISTPERKRIIEQVRETLGSGAIWLLADAYGRLRHANPSGAWDIHTDESRPELRFITRPAVDGS